MVNAEILPQIRASPLAYILFSIGWLLILLSIDGISHCHLRADFLENVGASTSHNSMGLHGLLHGELF
jgi:hypothetical protein